MPNVRGPEIRTAYEDMGLTREDFAKATDIPAKTITNITTHGAPTSWPRVARIADALGWKVAEVLVDPALAKARNSARRSRSATPELKTQAVA